MKNKVFSLLVLGAFASIVPQATIAQPVSTNVLSGPAKDQEIAKINRSINSISRMEGRFVQTNPNGSKQTGKFYISRPGKVRFEYDAPSQTIMVSDGSSVGVSDFRLKSFSKYPLKSTPLYFLLKSNVNIPQELNVKSVIKVGNLTVIAMRDKKNQTQGELRIVFSPDMQIQEWVVINAQNQMTYVQLTQKSYNSNMSAGLFRITDPRVLPSSGRPGR